MQPGRRLDGPPQRLSGDDTLAAAREQSEERFVDVLTEELEAERHGMHDWVRQQRLRLDEEGQHAEGTQEGEEQHDEELQQDEAEEDTTSTSDLYSPAESEGGTSSDVFHTGEDALVEVQALNAGAAAASTSQRFDPALASAHGYLGDVEDLQGGYGYLEEGSCYFLPVLPLEGVVLFPGSLLPFKLSTDFQRSQVLSALNAPAPCARLLVVLHTGAHTRQSWNGSMVGCTAELRKAGSEGNVLTMVAVGRQRVLVDFAHADGSRLRFRTTILGDGCQEAVPRPICDNCAWVAPWAARAFDVHGLAARVRRIAALVLAPVSGFSGTPLELSYWIASNLPMGAESRQVLLESRDAAQRLRAILLLLQALDRLVCASCGAQVATTADAISMTQEGLGGVFVNTHGYIHDLVTFGAVGGLQYTGRPEREHSWFPGYAWTIAHCNMCGEHLGWRFNACATRGGAALEPKVFWGLRRSALTCTDAERSLDMELGAPDPDAPHQWAI